MPRFRRSGGQRIQFTAEEEAARDIEEQAWADGASDRRIGELRDKRNILLKETDFYALADVTMSEAMETYRQELRDLPSGLTTVEDVANVTWPTKP